MLMPGGSARGGGEGGWAQVELTDALAFLAPDEDWFCLVELLGK